jgi:hypothetical protein
MIATDARPPLDRTPGIPVAAAPAVMAIPIIL